MGRNVFELLSKLPKHGVGAKVARNSWKEGSYWTVTNVKLSLDGTHGQVWGKLTWAGAPKNEQPTQLGGPLKKVWRVLESPAAAGTVQWESLAAAAALRQKPTAPAATEAAAGSQ